MELEYILFVKQDANFCSRVLLAPVKLFLEARRKEYDLMKEYSTKNVLVNGVRVANLLVQNIVWEDGIGTMERAPWFPGSDMVQFYADRCGDDWYLETTDREWAAKALTPRIERFDHAEVYQELLFNEQYRIIDSFLILEADNGVLRRCAIKTDAREILLLPVS